MDKTEILYDKLLTDLSTEGCMKNKLLWWFAINIKDEYVDFNVNEEIPNLACNKSDIKFKNNSYESDFLRRKAQFGVIYGFHGSPKYNWYSILRTGLINVSQTAFQLCGNAYGNGIYLAVDIETSRTYTSGNGNIAICEIINDPTTARPNPFYVIKESRDVRIAYII
ncbi:Poly(ADP-ribose) polymerase catalytic domain protein [uncultured archaeon]|nr:Poly(ADP-ribose) polymerase catalytic domain protein [uncultured archaeon]